MFVPYKDILIKKSQLKSASINISGYKHAAVQLIAASVIHKNPVIINNAPKILDTVVLAKIVEECGGKANFEGQVLSLNTQKLVKSKVPPNLSKQIHGSLYFLPALLARLGKVEFFKAGGCQIGNENDKGERPIEHMLSVMESFGAEFFKDGEWIKGQCEQYRPTTIDILSYSDNPISPNGPYVSGATKTAILCAMGCKEGTTRILNPYMKPDVVELLLFLKKCGYIVEFNKKEINITIPISTFPCTYNLMSDISEMFTFIALSVHTRIPLQLKGVTVERAKKGLYAELELLEAMGIKLKWGNSSVFVEPVEEIIAQNIQVTSTGIYSDHHPFFTLMLLKANGTSTIEEYVWRDRFKYIEGLKALGANIKRDCNLIEIKPSILLQSGKTLTANELRGAAVLILASLTISGTTIVKSVDHIIRGYENFFEKLELIGVKITFLESASIDSGEIIK
ncbi:hypothetical protein ACFSCZ_18025 [Siminovitchia sediminis]|uniref:UDP-N-acetylglucosamine 1-carboxyvinyltransferase n=1 Tax=Siminovitchia sediminis TaxID=1274353 RepID=A0ABW4KLG5_9BACI